MKKVLRLALLILVILIVSGIGLFFWLKAPMPDGETGEQAELLTDRMLASLNYDGYQDLNKISWTFMNAHSFVWDKKAKTVLVEFEDAIVLLKFNSGKHEILKSNGLSDEELIQSAIEYFFNDSFWLVAPFKVRDKGVERSYVETIDGPGLLVTYKRGGLTPGDTYLWVLDENFRPKYWRIWTSNVPIGGMKFKWKSWEQQKGIWFSTRHPSQFFLAVNISDLVVE